MTVPYPVGMLLRRETWQMPQTSPWVEAAEVAAMLHAAGHEAVFVGGCVRDQLLDQPCHDCDLATDASPDAVQALFPNTVAVGKTFGVIIVVHRKLNIEVASFRHDGAYIDGRRPGDVRPGDEAGDMQRRDFTINALVADPQRSELRDHVGGIADLKSGTLRVVGDAEQRLREDRLRVLRGIRFAARYKLSFAPTTHAALATVRPEQLSRERMWEEWHKALKNPGTIQHWWRLLRELELLSYIVPQGENANLAQLDAVFANNLPMEARAAQGLILFCCYPDVSRLDSWIRGEPISKELRNFFTVLHHNLSIMLAGNLSHLEHIRLARDATAAETATCLQALGHQGQAQQLSNQIAIEQQRGAIPPLLNGSDLKATGIAPGPTYAALIKRAEDTWLLGEIHGREEALTRISRWSEGLKP